MSVVSKKKSLPQAIFLKDYTPPSFCINKIDLHFELTEVVTVVKANMHISRCAASRDLVLYGEDLTLDYITLNKQVLDDSCYALSVQGLVIYQVPDHFELEIRTYLKPQENTQLSGLYRSRDFFCTQCEAEGFRRIMYFLDRPDVLTRFTKTIVADKTRYPYLLSNGNPIHSGELAANKHWVTWEDPFKKPSYLFALVAGDFAVVEDVFITCSGKTVTLKIFVEKGYSNQCQYAMQSLKKAMHWDEENYGREYDLDIYMIVAVDDFNMGAMENKGLNIFNTKYILADGKTATDEDFVHIESVVAHEYFHNWSGNRVTCRDWFQLSLKEGLTIFRDQSFTQDSISTDIARIHDVNYLRLVQFPEDAGPLAHSVRPESYMEINNFYTTTVYNKGSEVIRMLQTILGKVLFRKGMDLYFSRYDGQAVTIENFIGVMEEVSAIDLTQFRLWYSQAGTPVLNIKSTYDEKKQTYALVMQQTLERSEKKPMHIPIKMGLLDSMGEAIPLYINNEGPMLDTVLQLKSIEQRYEFTHIQARPIPSLLRDFSAPVKLHYNYTDEDLILLFSHDSNGFNRWEAGQKYMERVLLRLVADYQDKKPLAITTTLGDMFIRVLESGKIENNLLASMLVLPSEKYLAEQMPIIDITAIHVVREYVLLELAKALQYVFLQTYKKHYSTQHTYKFNNEEMGKRRLKNTCLSYLMLLPEEEYIYLGMQQFKESLLHNMTDTVAAFKALVDLDHPVVDSAIDEFYVAWHRAALIVDKWFAIQAGSKLPCTLSKVQGLFNHETFDIKNPNKVYALIGTFCNNNLFNFHASAGHGYVFLRECILKLDKFNPQIAARMIKPLTEWRRYDAHRQQLMKEQLEMIVKQNSLSRDVYELASKSLL